MKSRTICPVLVWVAVSGKNLSRFNEMTTATVKASTPMPLNTQNIVLAISLRARASPCARYFAAKRTWATP